VYSVQEKRVLCRGQGHKSWVSQVAFDPYTSGNATTVSGANAHSDVVIGSVSSAEDIIRASNGPSTSVCINGGMFNGKNHTTDKWQYNLFDEDRSRLNSFENNSIVYRIGTVSADTQLCLWDVTDELLGPSFLANGPAALGAHNGASGGVAVIENNLIPEGSASTSGTIKESKTSRLKKLHKRGLSFGNRHGNQAERWSRANIPVNSNTLPHASSATDEPNGDRAASLFGTQYCPKMDDVPILEPLIMKKIAQERLTTLCFREDCLVTACQEGFICTWARPNRVSRL